MRLRLERLRSAPDAERDGWLSLQAGLVAVAMVGITMATFGPLFHLAMGYALLAGAFIAAAFAIRWADRASHSRAAVRRALRDARGGQILSGAAIILISYLSGGWILLATVWPLALFFSLVAWSLHRDRIAREVGPREVKT
jgi:hypothetical protein